MMSSSFVNAQNLPKEITDLKYAQQYLAKHILELDPIEGIYDVENLVEAAAGSYGGSLKQHFTMVILNVTKINPRWTSDEYDFMAWAVKGEVKGGIGAIKTISKGSFYLFAMIRGNGNSSRNRFKLENGISFSIKDRLLSGNARRDIETTAIKSYPTLQMYNDAIYANKQKNSASSGTGFFISSNGYIVTNNHVIENAQNGNIKVTGINEDYHKSYKARVEVTDKQNDLAILKIVDASFSTIARVPYAFRFNTASVGEECFVLGYPLISSMGKDIKLTTGIISSKTGFDGNIAQYQISAPVQPGNSGGPLFDKNGNIIGIVQAKHTQAENAGYAIKASYIRNLVELLPTAVSFPQNNLLKGKTLPQQVEQASKTVCLIIVNGKD